MDLGVRVPSSGRSDGVNDSDSYDSVGDSGPSSGIGVPN